MRTQREVIEMLTIMKELRLSSEATKQPEPWGKEPITPLPWQEGYENYINGKIDLDKGE